MFLLLLSAYHAGLNDKLRSSVLDSWISSKIQVVVATVAFGYDCIYNLNCCFLFFFLLGVWVRGIDLIAPVHDCYCDVLASLSFIYAFGAYSGAWTVIVLLVSVQDGMKLNYHLFKRTLTIIFCFFFFSPCWR